MNTIEFDFFRNLFFSLVNLRYRLQFLNHAIFTNVIRSLFFYSFFYLFCNTFLHFFTSFYIKNRDLL